MRRHQGLYRTAKNTQVASPCVISNGTAVARRATTPAHVSGCTKPIMSYALITTPYSKPEAKPYANSAGMRTVPSARVIAWFRNDEQVVAIGRVALLYACAVMPFMAYSTFVNQLYQCLGFKLPATVLASLRQGICFLPLIFILPHYLGLAGVQATQPASDLLTFFICIPFQIAFFRKHLQDSV